MFGVPVGELVLLAAAIVVGGIVTGLLAGMFGIGGGAVIVPVLFEVFGVLGVDDAVRLQLCVGTSLAIIVPTNLRSFFAHRKTGAVNMTVARSWAIPTVIGVAIGSVIAAFAPPAVLKIAFVMVISVVATKPLSGRDDWRIADTLPGRAMMSVWGFVVGVCSSLMGVSGGSISNMIQTLYNVPIHQAVATSTVVGVPITIAGTLGYMAAGWRYQHLLPPLSIGFVSLIGFALMAPISSYAAPFGARLAHATPKRRLEIGFGIFLLIIIVRFIVSLL